MPIPKVACTSIKNTLIDIKGLSIKDPMAIHSQSRSTDYRKFSLNKKEYNYFKFAIVRNPFERLVSCFNDKVKSFRQHNDRYHFDTRYNRIVLSWFAGKPITKETTFNEFTKIVSRVPDWIAEPHFKSQASFLKNSRDQLIPDYIGKLEELPDSWQPIKQAISVSDLPRFNRSEVDRWSEYYTSVKMVDLVAERYQKDIAAFDYHKEYEELRCRF
jgi:hypothetical protein